MPPRAAYWVCTVEAMPVDIGADFLAVDEIQLCGDPDRGHIFTDRLLNARGLQRDAVPRRGDHARRGSPASSTRSLLTRRERFSQLSYTGVRKISRMPPRSAIVGFSVEDVYAIAELLRRQKGGAAVVMGALSPAHPQRPGRALPERRRRPSGRHRRHRHGAEPRHQPRRLLRPGQVRRPQATATCRRTSWRRSPAAPGATPPTAPSASPARRRRSSPRWSRRSRATASARSPACSGATPPSTSPAPRRLVASLEAPGRPSRPAARPRGRRPRDPEGARGRSPRCATGCAASPTPGCSGTSARSPTSAR